MKVRLVRPSWYKSEPTAETNEGINLLDGVWREATNLFIIQGEVRKGLGKSEPLGIQPFLNDVISQKIAASSRNNLIPIVCIGELSTEEKSAQAEVKTQIRSAVKDQKNLKKLVIAYEPTWAIGVEHPASAEHINKMCALIRSELEDMKIENFQILYGGSAGEGLFEMISQTCDGLFLGRRSHNPQTYVAIVQECISIKAAHL